MARSKRKKEDQPGNPSTPEAAEPKSDDAPAVKSDSAARRPGWAAAGLAALAIFFILAFLFRESFLPGRVLFSNDAPMGLIKHFFENGRDGWGTWADHTWVGFSFPAGGLQFSAIISMLCTESGGDGAVTFANFYAPACLWLLGMCAWVFFRQLGGSAAVCLLGALAAALNGAFFTYATWGLPMRALAAGMTFLALAALVSGSGRRWWPLAALAGLAVGQGVMEAYDIGAIFSLYAAAYGVFLVLNKEGWSLRALGRGVAVVALMAGMAGMMAYHSIASVRETQTQGIVAEERSADNKWNFATQWSLPKTETARVAVPGLFGYRMDGPPEERYWGGVGRTPGWEEHKQGMPHHSGYGVYAGLPVLLIALWGVMSAFRREGSPFSVPERRLIFFTAALALLSLGLAWGRHSIFYQLIQPLPFFKDIRNPIKFMQPFSLLVVILFGLGLMGMARLYLEQGKERVRAAGSTLRDLVNPVRGFEPAWFLGSVVGFIAMAILLMAYTSAEIDVVQHITKTVGFPGQENAQDMARFSLGQALRAMLVLFFSIVLLLVIPRVRMTSTNALTLWTLLGLLVVADLGRGNSHYIHYWQHKAKYPENSVLKFIGDRPGHERVTLLQNEAVLLNLSPQGPPLVREPMDAFVIDAVMRPQPESGAVLTNDLQRQIAANMNQGLFQYKTLGQLMEFVRMMQSIIRQQTQEGMNPNLEQQTQAFRSMPCGRAIWASKTDPVMGPYCQKKLGERMNQLSTLEFVRQFASLYNVEWTQHQIPYHSVPMLDIVMEPRPLKADHAFRTNFAPVVPPDQVKEAVRLALRKWELTSTRHLLCLSGNADVNRKTRNRFGILLGYTNALNHYLDPARRRFASIKSFGFEAITNSPPGRGPEPHDPVTFKVKERTDGLGQIALVEFEGALPRAKLFANWRQGVADPDALQILASPGFDPHQQIILAEQGLPEPDQPAQTSQLDPVEYIANRAKYIELKTPPTEIHTVLLLNDRHNPDWKVTIDGQPANLLRANFLMRAVALPPSKDGHTVVFRYLPSNRPMAFSGAAGLAGLLFGFIGCWRFRKDDA